MKRSYVLRAHARFTPLLALMIGCANATDTVDATVADASKDSGVDIGVDTGVDSGFDAGVEVDAASDAGVDPCDSDPCFEGVVCTSTGSEFACGTCPVGLQGDGIDCTEIDGCVGADCFAGVVCTDVPAPGEGFVCGECPPGLEGDGVVCTEIDGCAGAPCLPTTSCTDVASPGTGFTCSTCVGAACPILRALAGPDQAVVLGAIATLDGDAVGYNGAFTCRWTNDRDPAVLTSCTATVAPINDTLYTLEVTDASGASATDALLLQVVDFAADAGPDTNLLFGETATLTASWIGASCPDTSCIACEWRLSDQTLVASTCTATVSPSETAQLFLTVTDTNTGNGGSDSATVFITDRPAQLCGWNVVVMTSVSYPTAPNPNYVCDPSGTARRQTINGKPAIVLSDLVVQNVRISGHISVETTSDDDLIGFFWGWQNPKHFYLLSWKQLSQNLGGTCGNAAAGIAIKKVDGATTAPDSISFNPAFGFNATDYVYECALGWSTARANAALLGDNSIFLVSPSDPGAFTGGWRDNITYRFEFYYTPTRTKVLVYEDDLLNGSTANLVTTLDITDSSYPSGAFAFYSNSQEQVSFGDFILASLDDFAADAGPDVSIAGGSSAALSGAAALAVPPFLCEWSDGAAILGSTCDLSVSPAATTSYTLTVTDDFGRVSTDSVTVTVAP